MMNKQQTNTLVHNLYQVVDNKDIGYLKSNLAEQIRFRIGNNPAVTDKTLILEANSQFFSSIKSMAHRREEVGYQAAVNHGIGKASC